jgi:hypothetical protein
MDFIGEEIEDKKEEEEEESDHQQRTNELSRQL